MKFQSLLLLVTMILVIIGLSGCFDQKTLGPEVKEYFDAQYLANDDTILKVITVNGGIKISIWDGENITLNATKRSRAGYEDLQNAEIQVTEKVNEITIEIQHTQPINTRAVDLDIKIPLNVTIESATTTNGPIQISGTIGDTILAIFIYLFKI